MGDNLHIIALIQSFGESWLGLLLKEPISFNELKSKDGHFNYIIHMRFDFNKDRVENFCRLMGTRPTSPATRNQLTSTATACSLDSSVLVEATEYYYYFLWRSPEKAQQRRNAVLSVAGFLVTTENVLQRVKENVNSVPRGSFSISKGINLILNLNNFDLRFNNKLMNILIRSLLI